MVKNFKIFALVGLFAGILFSSCFLELPDILDPVVNPIVNPPNTNQPPATNVVVQPTNQLILWNKLGSVMEVSNSAIGSDGSLLGTPSFPAAQHGNGLYNSSIDTRAVFPETVLDGLREGCVEFWIKADVSRNLLPSGSYYLDSYDSTKNSGIQVLITAGGTQVIGYILQQNNNTITVTDVSNKVNWNAGDKIHIACVFDADGINGTGNTFALYINGTLVNATPGVIQNNQVRSGLVYVNNHRVGRNDLSSKDTIDNLKVWNYAKTDFSDRFTE